MRLRAHPRPQTHHTSSFKNSNSSTPSSADREVRRKPLQALNPSPAHVLRSLPPRVFPLLDGAGADVVEPRGVRAGGLVGGLLRKRLRAERFENVLDDDIRFVN